VVVVVSVELVVVVVVEALESGVHHQLSVAKSPATFIPETHVL